MSRAEFGLRLSGSQRCLGFWPIRMGSAGRCGPTGGRLLPSRLTIFSGVNYLLFFKFRSPLCSGRKNSRTMLLPLLQKFPEQVRVSLFHTPNLRGLLRLLIPERFNETIGLQHIKVYLFDNNVILSG